MKKDGAVILVCLFGIIVCTYIIGFTELNRKEERKRVHCDVIMGGWHPDVAQRFIEMCAEARQELAKQQSR
jgi:hypothetical protein